MIAYYTALIVLRTNTMPATTLKNILARLNDLGTLIKYTDIICTRFLRPIDEGDFLNEAVLISTTLSKEHLENRLKSITNLVNIDCPISHDGSHEIGLDLVTYGGKIVNKRNIIKYPFLFDYIKQLQPELLVWRSNT